MPEKAVLIYGVIVGVDPELGQADLIVDDLQIAGSGLATGLTAGTGPPAVPQGPLGVLAGGAAANAAGAEQVAAIGPAVAQPRRVPSTRPVAASTLVAVPVLTSRLTLYLDGEHDDEGAGLDSPSLLDSETLRAVASDLAAISGSQAKSTGKKSSD